MYIMGSMLEHFVFLYFCLKNSIRFVMFNWMHGNVNYRPDLIMRNAQNENLIWTCHLPNCPSFGSQNGSQKYHKR